MQPIIASFSHLIFILLKFEVTMGRNILILMLCVLPCHLAYADSVKCYNTTLILENKIVDSNRVAKESQKADICLYDTYAVIQKKDKNKIYIKYSSIFEIESDNFIYDIQLPNNTHVKLEIKDNLNIILSNLMSNGNAVIKK